MSSDDEEFKNLQLVAMERLITIFKNYDGAEDLYGKKIRGAVDKFNEDSTKIAKVFKFQIDNLTPSMGRKGALKLSSECARNCFNICIDVIAVNFFT